MNGPRGARESTGWGTVVAVALLGLVAAALVMLTPWHTSDLPGTSERSSRSPGIVVEVYPPGTTVVAPVAEVLSER
jgi:hypothetical protein